VYANNNNNVFNIISVPVTTDNSYWNACGKMRAWFREHTYSSGEASCYRTSSVFLNGKVMNVNALNTFSDS
jgi:hypothetical protein